MLWERIGYAVLCVVVPLVWGLVIYAVSTAIEARVSRQKNPSSGETVLPLDYHI